MAQYTTLQSDITVAKSFLTQLNTALTDLSTAAVSVGSTAPAQVELSARVVTIKNNIIAALKEVADLKANIIQ